MSQELIVGLVLTACVLLAARWLWRRLHAAAAGDARCAGCPLADSCAHKGRHEAYGGHSGHSRLDGSSCHSGHSRLDGSSQTARRQDASCPNGHHPNGCCCK
ncbi:MAG: hypothetical protein IJS59_02115 [Bacteroidaceae bacterium]|nr:hypothetical protein [Bacteroidaceae bacterium]